MELDPERLETWCERVDRILDERERRLVYGALADMLGRGGTTAVARAANVSRSTVATGMREVRAGVGASDRVRRPGGGRPRLTDVEPELLTALDVLVGPIDDRSALRWTTASLRELAARLAERGLSVSPTVVADLLRRLGFSVRTSPGPAAGRARLEEQFAALSARAGDLLARGEAVASAVTERSTALGRDLDRLRETRPTGGIDRIGLRDFVDPDPEAPVPYGVFDIGAGNPWVEDSDGAEDQTGHAVEEWWSQMGGDRYPRAATLLVVLGGRPPAGRGAERWNGMRRSLSSSLGLDVELAWFPPGTCRWRRVDHRLFHLVTANRRGEPLASSRTTVEAPTTE